MISSCRFDIILRVLKKIKTSTEDGSEQRLHVSDLTLLRESPKSIIIFFLVYVYMPVHVCAQMYGRHGHPQVLIHP